MEAGGPARKELEYAFTTTAARYHYFVAVLSSSHGSVVATSLHSHGLV